MEFKLEIIHNFCPLDGKRFSRLKFRSSLVGNYYVKTCKIILILYLWSMHVYVSPHVCMYMWRSDENFGGQVSFHFIETEILLFLPL